MTRGRIRFAIIFMGGFLGGQVYAKCWESSSTSMHLWAIPLSLVLSASFIVLLSSVQVSSGRKDR